MAQQALMVMVSAVNTLAAESSALTIEPAYLRLEVSGGTIAPITFTVTAKSAGTIIAAESNCRCLAVTTPLPVSLSPEKPISIKANVAGVDTGVELLVLRTTLGPLHAQVQVVTGGLGQGKDVLAALLKRAADEHLAVWILVYDLQGQVRNCGCSTGSLGGLDHLVALPAFCRTLAPAVSMRFLYSGDCEGGRSGVENLLRAAGWGRDDKAVIVSSDPASVLANAGVVAVVVPPSCAINHRRLVRPLGSGGMTVQALLVDAQGAIRYQVAVPVDATLPTEGKALDHFPGHLSTPVDEKVDPVDDCRTCHRAAHKTWSASHHAHAWSSLKPVDRIDDCVGCHTTFMVTDKGRVMAPGVACQSCHLGVAAHIESGGETRTSGKASCQTCHNGRHDPKFRREESWKAVYHGLDPKKKTPAGE